MTNVSHLCISFLALLHKVLAVSDEPEEERGPLVPANMIARVAEAAQKAIDSLPVDTPQKQIGNKPSLGVCQYCFAFLDVSR